MADLRTFAARAACTLSVAALGYTGFALARTLAFARRPVQPASRAPRVTILKPLHGDEPLLAQKLASFCDQDYPAYEVIMGARDPEDPAIAVARDVARNDGSAAIVVSANASTPRHTNPKIDTLAALLPHATGEILVFADSDMRVSSDYLLAVVAPFSDPQVGAVTCLYRGVPADRGLSSALGAMANHEQFAPSVLVAETLMGMQFGFGATIAVRRELFDAIGGLDTLGTLLADDAELCRRVRDRGHRVVLSRYVVENIVDEPTFDALWSHELRWARTHRTVEPGGYIGLALIFPITLALLHLAVARRRGRAAMLLVAATALRLALSYAARPAFGVRTPPAPGLVPLRDLLGFAVWLAAFGSRRVRWSGDTLQVAPDGSVERAVR